MSAYPLHIIFAKDLVSLVLFFVASIGGGPVCLGLHNDKDDEFLYCLLDFNDELQDFLYESLEKPKTHHQANPNWQPPSMLTRLTRFALESFRRKPSHPYNLYLHHHPTWPAPHHLIIRIALLGETCQGQIYCGLKEFEESVMGGAHLELIAIHIVPHEIDPDYIQVVIDWTLITRLPGPSACCWGSATEDGWGAF
ncbi:hypothetical protein M422DRAFT_45201 [Sphaerobolus stellatus SS14]|nr:hypothetical protein M422DRAFT_45201 [Sphaerobolus stellatus SS14]